jgi:PAS domain S-box-containing protein
MIIRVPNPWDYRRLGYSRDELRRMTTMDLETPDISAHFGERIQIQLPYAGQSTIRTTHIHKIGHLFPVDVNSTLIEYRGQKSVLAVCRDFTVHWQAE